MAEVTHGSGYVGTIPGLLKLLEIVFSLLSVILVSVNGYSDSTFKAFVIGFLLCLVVSEVLLILGLSAKGEPILNMQFGAHLVCFLYTLIVASILLAKKYLADAVIAGGVFGLATAAVYLGDAVHSFLVYRPI